MAESDGKLSSPVTSAQRRTAPADVFAYKLAQDDLDDSTSTSQQISQLLKSSPRSERSASQHFGDIMEGNSTGVVVMADFTPLERVVLTANGNLQRIIRYTVQQQQYIPPSSFGAQSLDSSACRL
jgi:hypothetical protein